MFSKVYSAALNGLDAYLVRVEADINDGMPQLLMVGYLSSEVREAGAELVLCTGGMSVDPDDSTPAAIRRSGARVVSYGAPVLPGAMVLLGYFDDGVPVLGLPGCVMYARRTVFDLLLPALAAGAAVTREEIAALGEGGLCLGCGTCTFPSCGFGK